VFVAFSGWKVFRKDGFKKDTEIQIQNAEKLGQNLDSNTKRLVFVTNKVLYCVGIIATWS
jgi:hypothetical protein